MKTLIPVIILFSGVVSCLAAGADYSVVERGPHHRVWQRATPSTVALGRAAYTTNSYIELASGMHYQDPKTGQWLESQEVIEGFPGGAVARQGQHRVIFANDLATAGAIDMQTPDGKRLTSHVLGLSYFDASTGTNVLIAEITNCQGVIQAPNQVIYENAFDAIRACVRYTYTRGGFEQDIILLEAPAPPEAYGLNPATTRLVVMTEFINPPQPSIQQSITTDRAGAPLEDEALDFGVMQIGPGTGFLLGADATGPGLRVFKQWAKIEGRQFLIEQVRAVDLFQAIRSLPSKEGASLSPTNRAIRFTANTHQLPLRKPGKPGTTAMQLASGALPQKGYVLDYSTVVTTNNFTFQGDMTYYVSGAVTLSGSTVLEGGSVIKFTNLTTAQVTLAAVNSTTAPYRPAVFTSKDDNTVGQTITGSTGSPTNYYGTMLSSSGGATLHDCRFSFASKAISTGGTLTLTNVQFVRCATPIYDSDNDGITVTVRNGLFWSNSIVFQRGRNRVFIGEHLTVNQAGTFVDNMATYDCSVYLTNCLLVGLSGWGNGVHALGTNQVAWLTSGADVFQTVGAGSAYLADNSPYRNSGTTNINPGLAANLKLRTTYPPIVLTNNITADTTLSPQAQRDTDIPDLGFHFDPLDYAVSGLTIANNLLLTNGVALATYGTAAAITLSGSGQLLSRGLAGNLNQIVRYNTVQEQSTTNWSSTTVGDAVTFASQTASAQCAFTAWSIPGGAGSHVNQSWDVTRSWFTHNQFAGGTIAMSPGLVGLTNCLWERVSVTLDDQADNDSWYLYNNLLRGGGLSYRIRGGSSVAAAYDNLFDRTSISKGSGSANFTSGYNGYVTTNTTFSGSQGGDVTLTNSPIYQTSYLGGYYYPTNGGLLSTLLNAGSRWATNAGLYQFTTTTNQVKEGATKVDIGFHSVAVDSSTGLPYDTDGDGIPDYLEDLNGDGNGANDPTSWLIYSSRNGLTGGNGLQVFTPLK